MLFDWLFRPRRHEARRELLTLPFPTAWLPYLGKMPFYGHLDERGQQRLRDDLRILIAEKEWEGCGGLVLTDEIKVTIAAQASLLLLNIEHEYFKDVTSILVYPSAYRTMPQTDHNGVVREGQANLGEAWHRGPVVLACDQTRPSHRHVSPCSRFVPPLKRIRLVPCGSAINAPRSLCTGRSGADGRGNQRTPFHENASANNGCPAYPPSSSTSPRDGSNTALAAMRAAGCNASCGCICQVMPSYSHRSPSSRFCAEAPPNITVRARNGS